MATSLQTANYGFGKYAPDDVTSYLTDYNGTMDKIDSAIKGVSDVANEAKATSDSNLNNIANLSQGLTATNKNVENLGKAQTAQGVEIAELRENIDNIVIGDYITVLFNAIHGSGTRNSTARKIGKYLNGSFIFALSAGTYTVDRVLPNSSDNAIDLAYVAGNPFALPNDTVTPLCGFRLNDDDKTFDRNVDGAVYYDSSTNFTRLCYKSSGETFDKVKLFVFFS